MIDLMIDGVIVGSFPSVYACWKPLDDLYAALPEQYETPINWRLVRQSDGAYIDSRGMYEGEYQHPDGLPAGLWYALAEDAKAFNLFFKKLGGWSHE